MTAIKQSTLLISLINLNTRLEKSLSGPLSLHGISLTEYMVLRQLAQAPEQKLRRIDLAQQVGLSASGVTRLLNPMEKTGLIDKEQVERDARVSLVTLTSAGKKILNDASATFEQTAQSVLQPLKQKDCSELQRLISALM
ncbi:MAG: transcriptional regulator [Gammaproteobacteria bacterium]|nr:transcriptional regulator [Gammaproteobacteria bacterium]MBJ55927.1 transcriptional regulator [Gammaproteobacteria bacterium]HBN15945.1 transcriptional regulator [Pseudohongiella sp.]|tara:strand:- start:1663 stop:2082 length:420 start_codon:yes stop_codon:yes gene_type:complete